MLSHIDYTMQYGEDEEPKEVRVYVAILRMAILIPTSVCYGHPTPINARYGICAPGSAHRSAVAILRAPYPAVASSLVLRCTCCSPTISTRVTSWTWSNFVILRASGATATLHTHLHDSRRILSPISDTCLARRDSGERQNQKYTYTFDEIAKRGRDTTFSG